MLLDVSKYASDIEARNRRRRTAREFHEPDRAPVCFGIGGSYYAWLFDCPIHEYYADPALQVEVQLKGIEWEYEYLKADSSTRQGIGYEAGPVGEAIVFGAEVRRPEGTSPRIVHMFERLEDVVEMKLVPPEDNPRLREHVAFSERFCEAARKMGVRLAFGPARSVGIHPPLSALCAIVNPAIVYEAMYAAPGLLKRALDRMFEAYCMCHEHGRRARSEVGSTTLPPPRGAEITGGHVGLADDNISQISGEMFREFEMPYYLELRRRYDLDGLSLHTDGPNDQHFRILADEVGLSSMDIGGFSSLEAAVRDMKGKVHIHGGLNCKDFYGERGLSEAARRKALEAIALAAPGGGFELAIGGECYVGVRPEGIRALVELVEERGTYPISVWTSASSRRRHSGFGGSAAVEPREGH